MCVPPSARDSTNQRNSTASTVCDLAGTVCTRRVVCRVYLTPSGPGRREPTIQVSFSSAIKAVPAAIQANRESARRRANLCGPSYTACRGTRTHERANDTSRRNIRCGNSQGSHDRWDRAVPAAASLAPPRWCIGREGAPGWMFVRGALRANVVATTPASITSRSSMTAIVLLAALFRVSSRFIVTHFSAHPATARAVHIPVPCRLRWREAAQQPRLVALSAVCPFPIAARRTRLHRRREPTTVRKCTPRRASSGSPG